MNRKLCFMASPCLSRKSFLGSIGFAVGVVIFCLFFNTRAYPQMALSIGDKLPDVSVQNVIHHSTNEVKLSEYRGKLLILDFWATWCSPCISMFPKTDSLQKVFKDQVMFLPVTYQPKEEVNKLLSRSKKLSGLSLPIATSDKALHLLFPHKELPHYVWIDSEGTVQAFTGHEDVTKENIQRFLKTNSLSVKNKNDKLVPFSTDQLLIAENKQIPSKNIIYQSAFTRFIEGIPSSFTIFPVEDSKSHRVVATNARIPTLFNIAYGMLQGKLFSDNTILLEMRDTTCCDSRLTGGPYTEWLIEHGYGYELIVPPAMLGQQAEIMQQDLARMFPQYKASIEKRSFACLALVKTSKLDKIKTKGGTTAIEVNPFGVQIQNHKFFQLTYQLNVKYLAHLSKPVIDQTDYKENIDLDLTADMSDVNSIRKALAVYDLDLIDTTHEIEVLVITDSKK